MILHPPPGLVAALEYAERGISVVPLHTPTATGCSCARGPACHSAGKHPRLDWKPFQERRATPEEIRAWWSRWPTANVGLVTGVISGLCVVDIDYRSGGFESLVELDARGFIMPDHNPVVVTGSGGLHHVFALDAPLPKSAPFAGIDVQADGALVVAPPSRNAAGSYRWARPLTSPWPPVPVWLRFAVQAVEAPSSGPAKPLANAGDDDVLSALRAHGLYLGRHRRRGLHRIRCPWAAEHSNGDNQAVVIEPGASPAPGWSWRCLHAHCSERTIGDLLDVLTIPRRRHT